MSAIDDQTGGFPDRGPAVFAVTTATLVLASVFVASRMISRIGIVKNVSYDDYIIIVAWVFAFFLSFTINLGTTYGLGRHDENIVPDDRPSLRKCEYVFSVLYVSACSACPFFASYLVVCTYMLYLGGKWLRGARTYPYHRIRP